jgi:FecR protein
MQTVVPVKVLRSIGCRWLLLLAVLILSDPIEFAHAAESDVGSISDVKGKAELVSSGQNAAAAKGATVHLNDELKTGADGYLQVTFRDDTVLTLAENARVVIDRYVFDPDQGVGDVLLTTTQGAFRFATGRLKELSKKDIQVSTPVADVGVRGTEFWGGLVDGQYSLVLLDGEINVRNQAGVVTLNKPGLATVIRSRAVAPLRPRLWSADQIQRAVARTFTQQGLKQFERRLRKLNLQGFGPGKDRIPDLLQQNDNLPDALKRKDTMPDAFKQKNRSFRTNPGGSRQLQRAPRIPKFW